jgi:tRNA(fMet)-specific endonuclease VapC
MSPPRRYPKTVIDSDTLSAMGRRREHVFHLATEYLREHPSLTFSVITEFEVLRGLRRKGSVELIEQFERICGSSEIIPVSSQIVDIASNIYADLSRRGQMLADADILIAATAIAADCPLATNNVRHFSRIDGLRIENWLA